MAKTLSETPITTRAARANLPIGLYWRGIDTQVHLGYRKGKRGGEWLVRWRHKAGYRRAEVGIADDNLKAGTLDYEAAMRAARKVVENTRYKAKAAADGPPVTVRSAAEDYIAVLDARESKRAGRPIRSHANRRLSRHLLGQPKRGKQAAVVAAPLAAIPLHSLKDSDLLSWKAKLPDSLKATSRQRLVNDLKAALNAAYASNRERLSPKLPEIVKHSLKAEEVEDDEAVPLARENQILSDGEIGRLLKATREIDAEQGWEGDLFRLVLVLAATGSRFSQLVRMRVSDCQIGAGRLMVPVSRKGKKGVAKKKTHEKVPVGKDVLDALVPITTDRPADAILFERWRWKQTTAIKWERTGRAPWQSPSELVRPWAVIRQRANMPHVIPYALRHSSIVKAIRANLPIRLIAAAHDTSIAMIERHYSNEITDKLEDVLRTAIVPLVPNEGGADVVQLRGAS